MTLSAGQVSLGVSPDTSGFGAKLHDGIVNETSALGSIGKALGGTLIAGLSTVVLGGAAIAGKAIQGGISRQLQIEDATAKLSGLGNSATAVTQIMSNAMASVKGTAFGMGEAATVAAGAVAAGIKPGQDLERILKLTGDSATIAGTSMGEMGGIFNKVASSGKVTGDVVQQLQDRGFPILQMLADKYGVSAAAASKMVSDGKVNFADFASSIEKNVGGAALKSGDTTKGAFANMNAALSRVGVTMTSGFFPLFKSVFNQITIILDGVNAKVKPAADAFGIWFQGKAGPIIAGFSAFVLAKFDIIIGGVRALVAAFQAGGDDITSSGFAGMMEHVGLAARHFTDWIVPVAIEFRGGMRALVAAFQDGGDDITSSGFAGAMEHVGLIARHAWDAAQPLFQAIGDGWQKLVAGLSTGNFSGTGDSIVKIFSAIGNIARPMGPILVSLGANIGDFGTQIGNLIAGALPLLAPIIKILTDALGFLSSHTELLTPIVLGIAAAFLVYKAGQTAANVASLASVPLQISRTAAMIASAMATNALADSNFALAGTERAGLIARMPATAAIIAQTAAKVATATATGVATAAQWLWNAAMSANPIALVVIAIGALVAGIIWVATQTHFFQDVWKVMTDAIGAAWNWLWNSVISPVVNFIVGAFQAVGAVAAWLWNNAVMPAINGIGAAFNWIWNNVIAPIGQWIGGAIQTIGDTVNNVFGAIGGTIRGAFDGVVGFIRGVINSVIDVINGVIGKINGLAGAVKDATGGAINIHLNEIPHLATGGTIRTPGTALVGENGPEIVSLPAGATVYPTGTGPSSGGGTTFNIYEAHNATATAQTVMQRITARKV